MTKSFTVWGSAADRPNRSITVASFAHRARGMVLRAARARTCIRREDIRRGHKPAIGPAALSRIRTRNGAGRGRVGGWGALALSGFRSMGPIAAARVGCVDGQ